MSSMPARRSFDLWDDFEHALSDGVGAIPYWHRMGHSQKSSEVFASLLLIEFESNGSDVSQLAKLVDQFESTFSNLEDLEELVRRAFDIALCYNAKPRFDQVLDLPLHLWRFLARPTDPFHLGQLIDGRYLVEQRIGHGAFGVVYRCRDKETDEIVACKALHRTRFGEASQKGLRQLKTERIAMQRLSGPGIPKAFSMSSSGESAYMIMEYIDGCSLRELMKQGPIAHKQVVSILTEVTETIASVHDQHCVIHRDLKPENVLIDKDEQIFVVDFGLIGSFSNICDRKRISLLAGTSGYIAPELLNTSHQTIDGRADIYAIGVMLFEMLTGELPPSRSGRIDESLVTWPGSVPSHLIRIGMRCLEPDPADRYENAYDLIKELDVLVGSM